MLTRFGDFDRTFAVMEELRRRMGRVWDDFDGDWVPRFEGQATEQSWQPRVCLHDTGSSFVLTADVPGMTEKDINVSINDGTLSISGSRAAEAPSGYSVHRRERPAVRFARSVALPAKVNAENTTATVKDGVLTITLAKVPEAQPRQIAVRAQS